MLTILLIADDPLARRVEGALAELAGRICRSAAEAGGEAIDVVVTDRPFPGATEDLALLRLDGQGPADVVRTPDVTAGEILLACQLLGRIARLRRELRDQAEGRRRLREEAFSDPVTEVPNRRAWEHELARREAAGISGPLCMAIVDLDQFKAVNDTHGHLVGDRVLRTVGQSLLASVRRGDFVARIGGDEFGLLLPISDPATAAKVVDRVRRRAVTAVTSAGLPPVSASAGFWTWPPSPSPNGQPLNTAFAQADAQLLDAKRAGGDCTRG